MSVGVAVEGAVGILTLDAPPLNLLSDPLRRAVLEALDDFRARAVRAVVLTGAGRAFCAGADLRDEAQIIPADVQAFLDADEAVFSALAAFPGATIAAVKRSRRRIIWSCRSSRRARSKFRSSPAFRIANSLSMSSQSVRRLSSRPTANVPALPRSADMADSKKGLSFTALRVRS